MISSWVDLVSTYEVYTILIKLSLINYSQFPIKSVNVLLRVIVRYATTTTIVISNRSSLTSLKSWLLRF